MRLRQEIVNSNRLSEINRQFHINRNHVIIDRRAGDLMIIKEHPRNDNEFGPRINSAGSYLRRNLRASAWTIIPRSSRNRARSLLKEQPPAINCWLLSSTSRNEEVKNHPCIFLSTIASRHLEIIARLVSRLSGVSIIEANSSVSDLREMQFSSR